MLLYVRCMDHMSCVMNLESNFGMIYSVIEPFRKVIYKCMESHGHKEALIADLLEFYGGLLQCNVSFCRVCL